MDWFGSLLLRDVCNAATNDCERATSNNETCMHLSITGKRILSCCYHVAKGSSWCDLFSDGVLLLLVSSVGRSYVNNEPQTDQTYCDSARLRVTKTYCLHSLVWAQLQIDGTMCGSLNTFKLLSVVNPFLLFSETFLRQGPAWKGVQDLCVLWIPTVMGCPTLGSDFTVLGCPTLDSLVNRFVYMCFLALRGLALEIKARSPQNNFSKRGMFPSCAISIFLSDHERAWMRRKIMILVYRPIGRHTSHMAQLADILSIFLGI